MSTPNRLPYPSDLSDEQWEHLAHLLPPAKPGGRPRKTDLREVLNAILYLNRAGCQWDSLPHDFPPKSTVYEYFSAWRTDGTWQLILDVTREAYRENFAPSQQATPSAASIDSQTVKGSAHAGGSGCDVGKKTQGRKRHIGVCTLGLLLAVVVTAADVDDAKAAPLVLKELDFDRCPRLERVWADGKYHNHRLAAWVAWKSPGAWELEVVRRPANTVGFQVLAKRWVVERTFAWLGRSRRLSRDYERRTDSSECLIRISSITMILNRMCSKTNTPNPFNYRKIVA